MGEDARYVCASAVSIAELLVYPVSASRQIHGTIIAPCNAWLVELGDSARAIHREFPFQDCKIPPRSKKISKIPVIETTNLLIQASNIVFN